jgi:hypothetical protein
MTDVNAVIITRADGMATSRKHVMSMMPSSTAPQRPSLFYVNLLAMDVIAELGRKDDVSSALGSVAELKSALRATVEWHVTDVAPSSSSP